MYEAGSNWKGLDFLGVTLCGVLSGIVFVISSLFRLFDSRSGFRGLGNSARFKECTESIGMLGEGAAVLGASRI